MYAIIYSLMPFLIDIYRFKCRHCGKGFRKLDQLKIHETIHDSTRFDGEPSFACDQCDQKYHLKVIVRPILLIA